MTLARFDEEQRYSEIVPVDDSLLKNFPPLLKIPSASYLKNESPDVEALNNCSDTMLLKVPEIDVWPSLKCVVMIHQKMIEEYFPELNENLDLKRDNPLMKDCPFYGPKFNRFSMFYNSPVNPLINKNLKFCK